MEYIRTDGASRDFITLCSLLDAYLDRAAGKTAPGTSPSIICSQTSTTCSSPMAAAGPWGAPASRPTAGRLRRSSGSLYGRTAGAGALPGAPCSP